MRNRYWIISVALILGISSYNVIQQEQILYNQNQIIHSLQYGQKITNKRLEGLNKALASKNIELGKASQQLEILQAQLKKISSQDKWFMENGIATAYAPFDNRNGIEADSTPGTTSIGLRPGNNVIAVDPHKIPYKSTVIVISADGKRYEGIAGDTGGALRSSSVNHVDIYKDTLAECTAFGVKNAIILWRPPQTTS